MKIIDTSVYLGPSLYAHFPVIRFTIDLGPLEEWPTGRLGDDFNNRLIDALPGLKDHTCSYGEPGGFVRRMEEEEGTWLGHVLEHCAIEIQCAAGVMVTYGKTRAAGDIPGQYHVVYEYEHSEVGFEAGKLALDLIHSLLPEELRPQEFDATEFNFEEERDAFIRFAQRLALGPSTAALVKAARERDIPYLRLNRYSLVQLGHGRYQKRIQATVTSETRHISVEIASDKEETNRILSDLGLPVAVQRLVYSEEKAVKLAEKIGFPVVVKPLNANHGRGVSINLSDTEQVITAYQHAREHGRTVIVESYIEGFDHRMLVVGGELIAVAQRIPGHVIGDGKGTIEELVEELNLDPRRGIGHERVLTRIEFDHQAERMLALRGYTRESVPPKGEMIFLRSTGNLSTGGIAIDMTDVVHPDNREMAIRAAKAIGLDVAGVDFLTTDISGSYKEVGGAICEINAAPGFRMHVAPSEGEPRDVAGPVMDMLFQPGTPSRIPIASITGTNGKTTTARMLAHIFKLAGYRVGLTTTDGVYIDGHKTVVGDMTGPTAARMVLRDPSVDVAVLETARGGMIRRGLGYRKCDVAACLNVQTDHLGLKGIDTLEELALVKRIPIEVAKNTAVLNADDPLCLRMADHTQAEHVCYITMNPSHALVKEHIQSGGRAVVLEEGITGQMITIYDHEAHMPLLWTHKIPATLDGRAVHNVQNSMFTVAMAYSMDLKLEDIRHGLQTFDSTYFQVPGRMNIFDDLPFKVILDYGHNPEAVKAMYMLVERLDSKGKRICVLSAPGDRRDEDIREIARLTAGRFDHYLCRRDDDLRGRGPDEIPKLLQKVLLENGVDPACIDVIPDEQKAVAKALMMGEKDDLLLIFGDAIDRCWNQITGFHKDRETAAGEPVDPLKSKPVAKVDTVESSTIELEEGELLIRDERGVRLAREEED
jgi:cyanophycin synthetase